MDNCPKMCHQLTINHQFDMSPVFATLKLPGNTGKVEVRNCKFRELTSDTQYPCDNTDEWRIALVQEILLCLREAKESSGTQCRVFMSDDEMSVNVAKPGLFTERKALEETTPIYGAILKLQSKDLDYIAEHFLGCAERKFEYIQDALNHPIFWTPAEKIDYFKRCLTREKSKPNQKLNHRLVICEQSARWSLTEVECKKTEIGRSWFDRLTLDKVEASDMRSLPKGNLRVSNTIIKKLAADATEKRRDTLKPRQSSENVPAESNCRYPGSSTDISTTTKQQHANALEDRCQKVPKYQDRSWIDFLRFFRNTNAHFWENNRKVRSCFSNDVGAGYWTFFSERFPGLFVSVYDRYKFQMKLSRSYERKFDQAITGS